MSSVSPESHVEQGGKGCVSVLWAADLFQRFGRWAQQTNFAPVLADVVVLAGFKDRDYYRFVPYFRYLSS